MNPKTLSTFLTLTLLITACNRDEVQGNKSLKGTWTVTEITSIYGDYSVTENGVIAVDETSRNTASGELGTFTFSKKEVTYSYSHDDSTYAGHGAWQLNLARVNQGFTKTNEWTLVVENQHTYDLRFEDQTKNAEKKANDLELDKWPSESGTGIAYLFKLRKK